MILTLFITIILEGIVALVYCVWLQKPARPILITTIGLNLFTQSLLWIALNLFFGDYLFVLLIAEILIWLIESVLLYSVRANQLRFRDAVLLSLSMNLASFALGWILSV